MFKNKKKIEKNKQKTKQSFIILKKLLPYMRPYKNRLIMALISMSIVSLLTGILAYIVKPLINDIFVSKSFEELILIPLLVIAIFIAKGIFYYMEAYYTGYVGQNIIKNIRNDVYKSIVNLPVTKLNKIPTGVFIARITYDVNLIQHTVSNALSAIAKDILTIIVLLAVIFYMDFYLAIAVFILFPIAIIPVSLLGKKTRKTSIDTQNEMGNITKFLDETISNLRIVKAYNMQKFEIGRFKKLSDRLYRFLIRMTKIKGITVPFVELVGGIAVSSIIFLGGLQVIKYGYSPGSFFSFLTAILLLYEPVKSLSRLNNNLQEGIAASSRVFEIMEDNFEDISKGENLPKNIERLQIKNLYFSYNKENGFDLKNINLDAEKGKIIAIVGRSGAGKSTLSMLIPGFYKPNEGEILINGKNINLYSLKEIRDNISYVSQQVSLFNESVKFNIAYGASFENKNINNNIDKENINKHNSSEYNGDNSDMIINAAKLAYAHNFVINLPEGYDTLVDESGLRLSGGEKQRILMARAFLKNAPILILDEATASLDNESERHIQEALLNLCRDKIAIVIAHRLSTVKKADNIYVMENGEIVEQGNHEELIEIDGIYKNLLIKQMQ
ncbi:MAG: ATP-binding cassette domain-containing protein [Candidatus Acididesulfobacter diazotrophicus]|uniref:ATP-binding cassette domain-containing protein n=1 Tax=Candidatus Acididesulfobacter diazotrophicus TaxID=2597226 RepID=A0A519BME9_9DELT|nr:MAG: ATP-binding cassette domain-containing protein [Candidatus Acididesulfobacter diazotrophicus]